MRHWKGLVFASFVGFFIHSFWVQNKTSKLRRATEEEVEEESPTNPDEMLELRALNDMSSAKMIELPALATRRLGRRGNRRSRRMWACRQR